MARDDAAQILNTPNAHLLDPSELLSDADIEALSPPPDERLDGADEPPPDLPRPQHESPSEEPRRRRQRQSEHVPYERFQTVAHERDELKRKVEEGEKIREEWARFQERSRIAREAAERQEAEQAQAAAVEREARREVDPQGVRLEELEERHQALEQSLQYQQQQQQQQQVDLQLGAWEAQDVGAAQERYSDYIPARDWLYQRFYDQLRAEGRSEQECINGGQLMRRYMVQEAAQTGQSVSDVAYAAACDLGYQGKHQPPRVDIWKMPATATAYTYMRGRLGNGGHQNVAGTLQARMPEYAGGGTAAARERLRQVERGQAMQGLGGRMPGAGGDGMVDGISDHMSAEAIADMDEELFIKYLSDPRTAPLIQKSMARLEGIEP